MITLPNSAISEVEPQQLESYIEVCALFAGFPLHTAFFVPPYSSQTMVDVPTHVSAGSTSTELSWQQMLQRHWESLQPNKLTGDTTKKLIIVTAKSSQVRAIYKINVSANRVIL